MAGGSGNGIQWLLELDAKLEGAKAMVKELTAAQHAADKADQALKKAENHGFKGFLKGMKDSVKEIVHANTKTETLTETFVKANLATRAIEKGAELAWEALRKIPEIFLEAAGAAAKYERTQRVFANAFGGPEGKESLEYLDKFAKLTEFTDDQLFRTGNELSRAGMKGAEWRNALAAAADVAASAEDKMQGLGDATTALAKAFELGKLDKRTIYALRLPFAETEEALQKGLGLSRKEIKKQLAEGTIDATKGLDILYDVMEKRSGKRLGAVAMSMRDTLSSVWEKMKNVPDEYFKTIVDSPGYNALKEGLSSLLEKLDPDSDTGKRIKSAFDSFFTTIAVKLKNIDWDNAITLVEKMLKTAERLIPVFEVIAKLVETTVGTLMKLPEAGEWLGDKLAVLFHTSLWDAIPEGATKGVDDKSESLKSAGVKMVENLDGGVRDEAEIHSPSRLFERHGRMLAEGLALGMERGAVRASDAAGAMMPVPGSGSVAAAAPAGINAGGITVNLTVDVAGGTSSSAGEIAQEIQAILPNMLIGALEQAAVQAGVS